MAVGFKPTWLALIIAGVAGRAGFAQQAAPQTAPQTTPPPATDDVPEYLREAAKREEAKVTPEVLEQRKKESALQRELKKLRAKHFRNQRYTPTREAGVIALRRDYAQPWMFPSLIEVFAEERDEDVVSTVCGILRDSATDFGDRGLAFVAATTTEDTWRAHTTLALAARIKSNFGRPPAGAVAVFQAALQSGDTHAMDGAAVAGQALSLIELIPYIIPTQPGAGGQGGAGGTGRQRGPLAWIAIGTQKSYVADLTPIVSQGAVAFDPTPGIVTEGTLFVVNDAVVTWSPRVVTGALTNLASAATGEDASNLRGRLGMRFESWKDWYFSTGKEAIEKKLADREAAAVEAEATAKMKPSANPATPQPSPSQASTPPAAATPAPENKPETQPDSKPETKPEEASTPGSTPDVK